MSAYTGRPARDVSLNNGKIRGTGLSKRGFIYDGVIELYRVAVALLRIKPTRLLPDNSQRLVRIDRRQYAVFRGPSIINAALELNINNLLTARYLTRQFARGLLLG